MTDQNALSSRWAEVVGMAWADEDFRRRLVMDPKREMTAMGIEVDGAANIRVVEETPGETLLVVPQKPPHIQAMDAKKPGDPIPPPKPGCATCGHHSSCEGSCSDGIKKDKDKECPDDKKPAKPSKPAKSVPLVNPAKPAKKPAKPAKPAKRKR